VPVEPCAQPLRLRNARIVRAELADTLIDLVAPMAAGADGEEEEALPQPVYCREPGATAEWGVYRPNGADDSYLIGIGDAGIALSVGRSLVAALLGEDRGQRRVSVSLLGRNEVSALPSFNRLPPPEQALRLLEGGSTVLSVSSEEGAGD
jgi:hypothetical protein